MRTSLSPVLSRLAGKRDGELVLRVPCPAGREPRHRPRRRAATRSNAWPFTSTRSLGGPVRCVSIRSNCSRHSPALGDGFESEEHDEGVRLRPCPAVHRARAERRASPSSSPSCRRRRSRRLLNLRLAARGQGELRVAPVGLADLPQQRLLGRSRRKRRACSRTTSRSQAQVASYAIHLRTMEVRLFTCRRTHTTVQVTRIQDLKLDPKVIALYSW